MDVFQRHLITSNQNPSTNHIHVIIVSFPQRWGVTLGFCVRVGGNQFFQRLGGSEILQFCLPQRTLCISGLLSILHYRWTLTLTRASSVPLGTVRRSIVRNYIFGWKWYFDWPWIYLVGRFNIGLTVFSRSLWRFFWKQVNKWQNTRSSRRLNGHWKWWS